MPKQKNEPDVARYAGMFSAMGTEALQELLGFLYTECCTRNKAIEPQAIVHVCK
jgi:hypothetical protein